MSDPTAIDAPPILTTVTTTRWWRWVWPVLAITLIASLVMLFRFNPEHHAFYPFCAFHRFTGLQCPGCGGLRAVHHLLHGEVITAFRFNQLFVLSLPLLAWLALRRLLRGPRTQPLSLRSQAHWAWVALAVIIVFWIVRNLPLEIFKLPAE